MKFSSKLFISALLLSTTLSAGNITYSIELGGFNCKPHAKEYLKKLSLPEFEIRDFYRFTPADFKYKLVYSKINTLAQAKKYISDHHLLGEAVIVKNNKRPRTKF